MNPSIEITLLDRLPTRRQTIDTYIDGFDTRDMAHARFIADSVQSNEQRLASSLVLIPVAAHQEAPQIAQTLEQYAMQETDQPFSVVLGLNSPSSEQDNPAIDATFAAIDNAKQCHPDLDVRTAMTFYDDPAIGTIRRDLWNGALLASLDQGAYSDSTDEIIGINHDIDLVSMSPRYIQRVQRHYQNQQNKFANAGISSVPLSIRGTALKHAASPQHPNTSKGAYWMDFSTRQMQEVYEASIVVPMSNYASKGGFEVGVRSYETGPLVGEDTASRLIIPGTTMQTSPRRYIDRLQYGYDNIWSDETFGANDSCRFAGDRPDISHEQLETIISDDNRLQATIEIVAIKSINQYVVSNPYNRKELEPIDEAEELDRLMKQEMQAIFDKKLRLSSAVLRRVIQSERLSQSVDNIRNDNEYRENFIEQYFVV